MSAALLGEACLAPSRWRPAGSPATDACACAHHRHADPLNLLRTNMGWGGVGGGGWGGLTSMGSATRSMGVRDITLFIAALSLTTARRQPTRHAHHARAVGAVKRARREVEGRQAWQSRAGWAWASRRAATYRALPSWRALLLPGLHDPACHRLLPLQLAAGPGSATVPAALTRRQHISADAARAHSIHPDLVRRQRQRHAATGERSSRTSAALGASWRCSGWQMLAGSRVAHTGARHKHPCSPGNLPSRQVVHPSLAGVVASNRGDGRDAVHAAHCDNGSAPALRHHLPRSRLARLQRQ